MQLVDLSIALLGSNLLACQLFSRQIYFPVDEHYTSREMFPGDILVTVHRKSARIRSIVLAIAHVL
jgi:hypothetical protein